MARISKTLSQYDFFTVIENSPILGSNVAEEFYRIVPCLLFASKWAYLNIKVGIASLCTRVEPPNKHDYYHLFGLIKYNRGTIHLTLLLGCDEYGNMTWLRTGRSHWINH